MDAPGSVRRDSPSLDDAEVSHWLLWAIESYLLAQAREVSHSIRDRVKAVLNKYPESQRPA